MHCWNKLGFCLKIVMNLTVDPIDVFCFSDFFKLNSLLTVQISIKCDTELKMTQCELILLYTTSFSFISLFTIVF